MRASRRAAAAILSLLALPWVPAAEAELRTVGLSGRQLKAWKAIVAVVLATDADGQPLHFAAIFAAAIGGRPLLAAADEPPADEPTELRLVFVDLCHTAPELRHGTLRAIQALLEPVGLKVTGDTAQAGEDRVTGGAYVVLMPLDPGRPRTQPVGGVARREYGPQLTVWAFPPWVAGGLGLDLGQTSRWTHRQRQQFERALAVVVVHELAHALAGAQHRPEGLMSPRLRREQLLDPRLVVDADLYPGLVAGVARLQAAASPRDAASRVTTSMR